MRYSEFLLVILFKIFNALKLNFLLSLILYMSTKKLITGSSNNKKKKNFDFISKSWHGRY